MNINHLIAEVTNSLKQYKASNLIDETSLVTWTYSALKNFGQSVCILQEGVVQVESGQAPMPNNFHSLQMAVKCNPKGFYVCEEDIPVIQNTLMWKERVERSSVWNSCAPCCKQESETVITENILINDKLISFYYESPMLLRLGKSMKKDSCANTCKNLFTTQCEYEISIINQTLYTNFPSGTVYLQYYGLEKEEDGTLIIPDTPRGKLVEWLQSHLKRRIIEDIFTNGDDPSAGTLLQYWSQKEQMEFNEAIRDAKFKTLTPDSYKKLAAYNKSQEMNIRYLLPSF